MNKQRNSFLSMGLPSIFTIFSVLCLVVLSLLTLGSSRSDVSTSRMSLEQTDAYYDACTRGTQTYLKLSELITKTAQASRTEDIYFSKMEEQLADIENAKWDAASAQISFTVPYSEKMALYVAVDAGYPSGAAESSAEILTWKTVNTSSWTPDTKQPVFKGDFQ